MALVAISLAVVNFLPLFEKDSKAANSFQANYNVGSYNANFSLGSSTASTDTALPSLNASGYGGTNSLSYSYDGTSTLKYPTASNLPADKGSIEMKFQKSAYGDAVDQDVGSMNGVMSTSYDLASGYIYTADRMNHRIIKTKIDGTGWQTYGHFGTGTGQFNYPKSVQYDSATGFLYVADAGNGRIVKTKMDGTGWQILGGFSVSYASGTDWAQENENLNVFYDSASDYLYVSNSIAGFVKTKIDGTGRTTYSNLGGHTFPNAVGNIYYDSASQYLYLAVTRAHKIFKTKIDGTGWLELSGFSAPSGIYYDSSSDYVYIANQNANNIVKTKIDGSGWATCAGFNGPNGLAFNSTTGEMYIGNQHSNNIIKTQFDGTGWTAYGSYYKNLIKMSSPYQTSYDSATGYYYIADVSNNRIIKTKIDGTGFRTLGGPTAGTGIGQFSGPYGAVYNPPDDFIYVLDATNNRVVKTKIDGTGWASIAIPAYNFRSISVSNTGGFLLVGNQYGVTTSQPMLLKIPLNLSSYTDLASGISGTGPSALYDSITNKIYVITVGTSRMYRMDIDGSNKEYWTGTFASQYGMDYDSSTGFFYIPTNNQIVKCKWNGDELSTFGSTGSGINQFSSPRGLAYESATGYIYIADGGNNRIVRTKIDGTGWQTTNDFTSKEKVLYSAQATDDSRLVYDVASRKLRFYLAYSNKAQFVETPTLNLTDGNWYTVKANFNKANYTLSIDLNGTEAATATYDADWGSLSYGTSFYIGARNGATTDRWDGMIDDVNVNIESVDFTDPTNPTAENTHFYADSSKATSFTSDAWGNSATPYITWSGASDADSGLKGYYLYLGTAADAEPNTTSGLLTPNDGAKLFQTHVGADGAEQNITVPASALTTGVTYYFRTRTQDNDLNSTDAATLFTYKYDGGAPSTPEFVNVSPQGCSTSAAFAFTWDAITDPTSGIAGYDYKNGSTGTVTDTGDVNTLSLNSYQEGDNIAYIRARDNAGNTSGWQTAVYCSTGTAHIIDGPTVTAGPSSITVAWTSSKPTTSSVRVFEGNTYISEQGQTSYSVNHSVKVIGLKPEKAYRYQLAWTDQNGNISESVWYNTTTSVAPKIIDLKAEILTPTQVAVSWKTDILAIAQIEYGVGNYENVIKMDGSANSFTFNLNNLLGGSNYQLNVKGIASDDTEFRSAITFQTPPLPLISGIKFEPITDQSSAGMKILWSTNVDTTSTVFFGPEGGDKQEKSLSNKVKEHEITILDLSDDTNYEMYASGVDLYGNTARSDSNTFKTALDSRPPNITTLALESQSIGTGTEAKSQIVVSFETDELTTAQVEYGEGVSGTSYTSKTQEDPTLSNSHVVIISNVDSSKIYHLRAIARDKAGNITNSEDNSVITKRPKESALNIILSALSKAFGWIEVFK